MMRKILVFILLLLLWMSGYCTNYYVSPTGNNAANGTSPATAWQTIVRVNTGFTNNTYASGDSILFQRGQTFTGVIIPTRSYTVGNPLKISAYGVGSQPIITGFVTVAAWTNLGANIWESTAAVSTLNDCNMVTINGVNTAMGRSPNTGWFTVTNHTPVNVNAPFAPPFTITSSSLNAATINWTGADVVMKTFNFSMQRAPITSQAGATITYTATYAETANNGFGFFLENDVRTLDVQNEWYYNPTSKKIRIFSTSMPTNVRVSTLDTLVYCINRANIVFDGLDFTGSNRRSWFVGSCQRVVFRNCNVNFSGLYGYWGGNNFGTASQFDTIKNCTFNNINSQGIVLGSEFQNAYIGHNTLKNIGSFYGMFKVPVYNGQSPVWYRPFGGIYLNFTTGIAGAVVEYNLVDSCAFAGYWWQGSFLDIHNNEAKNCVRLTQDMGGFYSQGARGTGTPIIIYTNCKVHDNLSHDNPGDSSGVPVTIGNKLSNGFYADENTMNTQYYNNSAWNNSLYGLFSNSNTKCSFINNTMFNNGAGQAYYSATFRAANRPLASGVYGIENEVQDTAQKNIYFSLSGTTFNQQYSCRFGSKYQSLDSFFILLDSNCYTRPIDETQHIYIYLNSGGINTHDNLAQWKTFANNFPFTLTKDQNAYKAPVTITNINQVDFEYNATASPVVKTLPAGTWVDVKGVTYNTGSTILQPYTSLILINTGANLPPIANAGTSKNITLPTSTVTQVGSGIDPDGTISAYAWTQFSGPATVTFGTATASTTTINGMTVAGTYVVRLTVTDNFGLTGTDTASIVVNAVTPPNLPPVVNAGGNKVITLPVSTVTQVGSAVDPDGSIASYAWTQGAGNPVAATIVSPTASTTVINGMTVAGTYTFTLTATDNLGLPGSQTITVIVNVPIPIAPVAHAGVDQTITYPTTSVTLTGSGTDADGTIVGYNWVKISGGAAVIASPTSATTAVSNLLPGVYQFELTVTDNSGLTGKDTMQVTANFGTSSISFSAPTLTQIWTGLPLQPTVITSPAGLSYSITFNNIGNIPVDTGTYVTRAAVTDPNYISSFNQASFRINPASASISVSNTVRQYDSTLQSLTIVTSPAGLATIVTGQPQRYKGTYAIHIVLNDPNHTATALDTTLTITPGQTTVTWTPADLTYPALTGVSQTTATSPKSGSFVFTPPINTLLNAGVQSLLLDYTPSDTNIAPILGIVRNINVNQGTTTITVSNTTQFFDNTPKPITASSGQSGVLAILYNGSSTPPTAPGDYPFTVTYSSANYTAAPVSGTLHILVNPGTIFITNYADLGYTGSPISVTVTSPYAFTTTYNGSATPPTNVNPSITVISTITDGIHTGADTVTMNIIKADPPYTWPPIAPITNPTPLSGTQLNISSIIPISVVYNPVSGTILGSGTHVISGTITPTDGANYNTITVTNTVQVNTGSAIIIVADTIQAYNGLSHSITATTIPVNLDSLDITYNGSHSKPVNAGTYIYSVSLINGNVTATPKTGTFIILQGTYALSWTPPLPIQLNSVITSAINNATSTIAGTFTYNYPNGTIMGNTATIALIATFHPTDSVNYGVQTITVPLSVFGNPFLLYFITHGNTDYRNLPGQISPFPLIP